MSGQQRQHRVGMQVLQADRLPPQPAGRHQVAAESVRAATAAEYPTEYHVSSDKKRNTVN